MMRYQVYLLVPSPWVRPSGKLRTAVNGFVDTKDQLKGLIEPRLNSLSVDI